MSILRLLGKHTFDVDTTIILASAFDAAWLSLQISNNPVAADDRAAETRELLARGIIENAERGERDKRRLVDEALAQFAKSTQCNDGTATHFAVARPVFAKPQGAMSDPDDGA
jgi:hypothetical protein